MVDSGISFGINVKTILVSLMLFLIVEIRSYPEVGAKSLPIKGLPITKTGPVV